MRNGTKKVDVEEHLSCCSKELAESGEHEDNMSIEYALRGEGYPEARGFLGSKIRRWELNRLCNQARRAHGLPLSPLAKDC